MKIAIIGLGLIGGSLAKAIKKNTNHICYGIDKNEKTVLSALAQEAIDEEIDETRLNECDVSIVCLYPQGIIDYILENKKNFKKGSIVIDSCGIKSAVVNAVEQQLADEGVSFLGCHPMAGREFSGFEYSVDNLFDKASFIMTPTENTDSKTVETISELAKSIGFAKCVVSDPGEHDRIIAFTSQLAHIVSNAYVKSPSLLKQAGFSAGSFKDLTRVAKLNSDMWTSLFMLNRDALLFEVDCIIDRLIEYRDALRDKDSKTLHDLLQAGNDLKEKSLSESLANEQK